MISHQKAIEFNKDCKCKFGAHVQAHDEPEMMDEDTQKEHTTKDICPQPTTNWPQTLNQEK